MAKWKYKLDVKKEWKDCKDKNLSIKDLIISVITKLEQLQIKEDELLDCIIADFKTLSDSNECDSDNFDSIWNMLYDWADQETETGFWPKHKLCWIDTFY